MSVEISFERIETDHAGEHYIYHRSDLAPNSTQWELSVHQAKDTGSASIHLRVQTVVAMVGNSPITRIYSFALVRFVPLCDGKLITNGDERDDKVLVYAGYRDRRFDGQVVNWVTTSPTPQDWEAIYLALSCYCKQTLGTDPMGMILNSSK